MINKFTEKHIPVLSPYQLDIFHFKGDVPITFRDDIRSLFHINRLEDVRDKLSFPLPTHRKTVYDFICIIQGHSIRSKNLTQHKISKNTFFFLPAYQISEHKYLSKGIQGFYCHFNIDLLIQDFRPHDILKEFPFLDNHEMPVVKVNEKCMQYCKVILERLLEEYDKRNQSRQDIWRRYLITLFTELKPFVQTKMEIPKGAAWTVVSKYKELLSRYVYELQRISDYAKLLNISPNHLNKCVKSVSGKSAHDLLNDMLLMEAKVLLKQTTYSIKEIAFKVGKNELSDFDRFFKVKTGMTPGEYRSGK